MRVLIWAVRGRDIPTGCWVLATQTGTFLQARGIDVEISCDEEADLRGFDLVHSFRCSPACLRRCRQAGLPIVHTTLYHRKDYFPAQYTDGDAKRMLKWRGRMGATLLRSALQGKHVEKCAALTEHMQAMRVTCEMADVLLTSSHLESRELVADLKLTTPYQVVPNGVDSSKFHLKGLPAWNERRSVLYAGRFDPDKNQLGLIRAMKGSKIPVVLVGAPHPHHPGYYEQCRREATQNITLLPPVPRQEDLLPLYADARVHVLPSWFETTGMVSLEAALSGCNVVTTSRGYAREYLQDMAWYCDPAHPASIRNAIEKAYHANYQAPLRDRILSNYTWEHTAQATLAGYKQALAYWNRTKSSAMES